MLDRRDALHGLIQGFTPTGLRDFLRAAAPTFRPQPESLDGYLQADQPFDQAQLLGVIELPDTQTVLVAAVRVTRELTSRSGKRVQYDLAKALIKARNSNAGIIAFYDAAGHFRFSLVTAHYYGTRRKFSNFRRYTFFVAPDAPNKTFINQIGRASFASMETLLQAFSLEAVSDEFYKEFKPHFDAIALSVAGEAVSAAQREDFALLFVIRVIFLGFVQQKGWLGDNPRFLQAYWDEYRAADSEADRFYRDWLAPLFFESLNAPPGRQVSYGHAPFSAATQEALQMAPYLNGELFKRKREVDDAGRWIPDARIGAFFDFLFQYNFTVEENELYDEELELNPEFLGIIFERLTNKDQGAVYTPRVEVDLMCRLALVKWLEKVTPCQRADLYHLFFREAGTGEVYDEYQRQGDFSPAELRALIQRLESVTVCDPAAGSGAFEVGMMQVLDQTLDNLYTRNNTPADLRAHAPTPFARKKAIIAASLYGVEVKRWAVWINHLRLWLSLFVDMPDEDKLSFKPLLPNLTFKVRTGDSLVQRVGDKPFPVQGHAALPPAIKRQITALKQRKRDFYYNESDDYSAIAQEELTVFRAILDAEMDARRAEIRKLLAPKPQQGALLPLGPEQGELDLAATTAARREALEAEIAGLQAQKRALQEARPFVWSIEFAEIFFDAGGFDIIIGNPPYVRQEDIRDPYGHLAPKDYKAALQQMALLDFPDYFAKSQADADTFRRGRKPSGRSDLYTYFYVRSLRLLNPGGVHVFICSNAWLDVGYGAWLQEFLLRRVPLHFVIDNHARRSFTSADVNTVITVADAPGQTPPAAPYRFVAFKQPFEDVVLSDNLLEIERATTTTRDAVARVFPITAQALLAEGSEASGGAGLKASGKYVGDKWGGKYLRAPDIFFTILEKGQGKLVRLGDVAEVQRGFTTGANDFFYLEPIGPGSRPDLLRVCNGAGWEGEIEQEFLKPAIKSPRESRIIMIDSSQLRYRLFMCHKSREELKGTGALTYITWGETQNYHKRPTCKGRRLWWSLGTQKPARALWLKSFNETFFVPLAAQDMLISDRFYAIYSDIPGGWITALNNTFVAMMTELTGRANLGEGALDNMTYEAAKNLIIHPSIVEDKQIDRDINSIYIECGLDPDSDIPIAEQEPHPLPDRQALDDLVFDALDLTAEERKEVYRAVCQLVWERISKAKG